jgi:hypothetical protein
MSGVARSHLLTIDSDSMFGALLPCLSTHEVAALCAVSRAARTRFDAEAVWQALYRLQRTHSPPLFAWESALVAQAAEAKAPAKSAASKASAAATAPAASASASAAASASTAVGAAASMPSADACASLPEECTPAFYRLLSPGAKRQLALWQWLRASRPTDFVVNTLPAATAAAAGAAAGRGSPAASAGANASGAVRVVAFGEWGCGKTHFLLAMAGEPFNPQRKEPPIAASIDDLKRSVRARFMGHTYELTLL